MPTVLPSQVSNLIADTGYAVLLESYAAEPAFYPMFTDVRPMSESWSPGGHKEVLQSGVEQLEEIEFGQEIHGSSVGGTRTAFMKTRKLSRMISFPEEIWRSQNAQAVMGASIASLARTWGQYAIVKKDQIVAGLFNNGALTAGSVGDFKNHWSGETGAVDGFIYDGEPFFDGAHLDLAGNSYANYLASGALSASTMANIYAVMSAENNRDERGERVSLRPDLLMVPADLRTTGIELLDSELKPGGSNNDINANRGLLSLIVNPYLTDSTGWFMGKKEGVRVYDSGVPVFRENFNARTQSVEVYVSTYISVGVVNWRFWTGIDIAAS
tara:strand:- start:113 stop:1093 length:981 start_codon:yes stop_codon:yes gene_type:complete